MGHEIIVYRDRHACIHDADLWLLRHFLLAELESTNNSELMEFVRGWEHIGPGVWIENDFDAFFAGLRAREQAFQTLLDLTRRRIEAFGESVPVDYLVKNVDEYSAAQPVDWLVQKLADLNSLFESDAQPAS